MAASAAALRLRRERLLHATLRTKPVFVPDGDGDGDSDGDALPPPQPIPTPAAATAAALALPAIEEVGSDADGAGSDADVETPRAEAAAVAVTLDAEPGAEPTASRRFSAGPVLEGGDRVGVAQAAAGGGGRGRGRGGWARIRARVPRLQLAVGEGAEAASPHLAAGAAAMPATAAAEAGDIAATAPAAPAAGGLMSPSSASARTRMEMLHSRFPLAAMKGGAIGRSVRHAAAGAARAAPQPAPGVGAGAGIGASTGLAMAAASSAAPAAAVASGAAAAVAAAGNLAAHNRTRSELAELHVAKREGPFTVAIAVNVIAITRIDTQSQTFDADVYMEARVVTRRSSIAAALRKAYAPAAFTTMLHDLRAKRQVGAREDAASAAAAAVAPSTDGTDTTASGTAAATDEGVSLHHTAGGDDGVQADGQLPAGWALLDWVEVVNLVATVRYRAWQTELADGTPAYRWRLAGTFSSRADLHAFPFDRQRLEIRISAARGVNQLRLVENRISPSIVQVGSFMLGDLWQLHPTVCLDSSVVPPSQSRSGTTRPLLIVTCFVDRHSSFYVVNIALPLALICLLTFSSYAIDLADTAARLNVTLTLVLTAVAYRTVLATAIPAVSYMTALDKYALAQLFTMVLVALENVVSGTVFADRYESSTPSRIFQGVIVGAWLIGHAACWVLYQRWRARGLAPPVHAAPRVGGGSET